MKRLFVCFLLAMATTAHAAVAAPRPNIVIMLVDDMGVMDTSLPFLTDEQGQAKRYPLNDFYRTPNMQRLAEWGVRFNQFCAMSVCSPTRASIMTGQNAARHHSTNWINPDRNNGGPNSPPDWNWQGIKPGDVTLASMLQANGYRTIHVGKGHFAPRSFAGADPAKLGFDVNIAGALFGAPGSYYAQKGYGKGSCHAVPGLEKYHHTDTFLTEVLTLEAKAAVTDAVKADEPFCLYFAHYAVHAPFDSDPRFVGNYTNSGKPQNAQAFATLIEGMDKSLGDLLDHLDELGIAEDTVVLFLGDNGTDAPLGGPHTVACAAPLRGKKGAHYEGGMRVPFIAAWAKPNGESVLQKELPIAAGAIQPQIASVCDLFPTIMKLTRIEPPSEHRVDGFPLQTLFTGKPDDSRPKIFLMHYPHRPHRSSHFTSFREGDWKVVYHYFPSAESGKNSRYQLYNLRDDPFEQNNLAGPEPDELQRMMQGLLAALEQMDAQYPVDSKSGVR